jgi:riboflavin synthase
MFTGIVQAVGRISSVTRRESGITVTIDPGALDLSDVRIGDSICVQGVCLTVTAWSARQLQFDISAATLDVTTGLQALAEVNLEKALRLADRLGGHLVQGHVDGVARVTRFEPIGESTLLEVEVPDELARYLARKGSVTVNGVSLTTNEVQGNRFAVNLIPHTLLATTLKALIVDAPVNVEVDLLARYAERLLCNPDRRPFIGTP